MINEANIMDYLKENTMFNVGLDVFEDESYMKPGLVEKIIITMEMLTI